MRYVGAAVLALVLLLSSAIVYRGVNSVRSWFPKAWDPRILPIANEVSALRGLQFKHPVQIVYLAPNDFEKQLGSDSGLDAAGRAEVKRQEAVFRALGWIGGNTDLLREEQASEASGTLAYYSPVTQMVYVRGTTLDISHRVTIAHELTHVLQDQNFDLMKMEKLAERSNTGDLSSYKGLVEGDAVRIQDEYLQQQSPADREEYTRENDAELQRVREETPNVPHILGLFGGAPYDLGPSTVRVLNESDGDTAINDALTGPTPSSALYVQAGDVEAGAAVDPPMAPDDGVAVGSPDIFGPYELYLMLADRLDPYVALEAADAVDGGSAMTFQRDGVICYSVLLDTATDSGKAFVSNAVQSWAGGRPGISTDDSGADVGFTACDPGKSVAQPPQIPLDQAFTLLEVRFAFTESVAGGGNDGDYARCVARVLVRKRSAVGVAISIQDAAPNAAQRAVLRPLISASESTCDANSDAGLP
jgi:hypothetical protein